MSEFKSYEIKVANSSLMDKTFLAHLKRYRFEVLTHMKNPCLRAGWGTSLGNSFPLQFLGWGDLSTGGVGTYM